ncbi:MAG: valine--tRNA ligase [Patescibacteria group bacterium]|nr:valine--tRNA ligase [Patescibacteria group bacterium]
MQDLPKAYDPSVAEEQMNAKWKKADVFNPDNQKEGKPFCMVFPPANVTGILHLGHALSVSIEDILARYKRMQGFKTLFLPGTDHAAIATQAKVEAELYKKDKKTHRDFSREEFLEMVKDYAKNSQSTILDQLNKLGASVDWSRLAYTMDKKRTLAVKTAFKRLYEKGLIYQGKRLVNWDPKLQTNVSDDEIKWEEETTKFYYFKYGPFTIGTTRPETKFGDKYVVMHPDDDRYSKYEHGQKIELEWINSQIEATIIKDDSIDMELGTGVMTITPAHDTTDYDIAQKHDLDIEPIIDLQGHMLPIAGEFEGQYIAKARKGVVEKLEQKGLLEKIDEKYVHRIATNSRGGGIIEPQIRKQWFMAVDKPFTLEHSEIDGIKSGSETTLKQLMRHVVESGQINIIPNHFDKTYFHWIDNLRDWNISRQIVFGHQIPVWYKNDKVYCDTKAPSGDDWKQDPDTLDTWFSSGLWSFSTLGWPEETNDLKTFHPNSILETGYDILFFWVARMVLMSGSLLGQVPFNTVYLHGLIRDSERQKMSKSKGNAIDPLDIMQKYGTDALRFSLVYANAGGTDTAFMEDRVKGMKHFANKLWNIFRFISSNLSLDIEKLDSPPSANTDADKQILDSLELIIKDSTKHIEAYRFNEAAQAIYQFVWHELADKYIEASKEQLQDDANSENTQRILVLCLETSLKLLHPFMPFITEYIWGLLGHKTILATEEWPKS